MSDLTETINDAIIVRLAAVLTTYSAADYTINPEENNERNGTKRYGCHPLGISPAETVHQRVTYDQIFQIVLIDKYKNRDGDSAQLTTTLSLFNAMDDILADLMHTKIGIPSTVMLVFNPTVLDPEYPEEDIVVLKGNITVKYRRST